MKTEKTKPWGSVLAGVAAIAFGVVMLLKAFGIDVEIFFDGWWTLFILVPCTVSLFTEKDKIGPLVGIAIGVCLLLAAQGVFPWNIVWKLLAGVALIGIGLSAVFKRKPRDGDSEATIEQDD